MDISNLTDLIKLLSLILWVPIIYTLYQHRVIALNILWKKFIGKPMTIKDLTIRKVAEQQLDLANLRIMYPKFRFRNIYHAKAIIKWCNALKIGVDDISGLHQKIIYDENASPKIRLNDNGIMIDQIATFIFVVLFGGAAILTGAAPFLSGVFGGVWLKMNDAGHYVWVEGTENVRRLTTSDHKPEILFKENCKKPFSETYALTEDEFNIFCKYFSDPTAAKIEQDRILKKSIWLSSILTPIFSIAFLMYLFSFFKLLRIGRLSPIARTLGQGSP